MRKIFLISMLSLFIFCSTGYTELIDNGDGTVTDTKTGLMWQKEEVRIMTWKEALAYSDTFVLAGHSDWRLPDLNELKSIADYIGDNPSIYRTIFPNSTSNNYWSSNTNDDATDYAWTVFCKPGEVYAQPGEVYSTDKKNGQGVRVVRGGQ